LVHMVDSCVNEGWFSCDQVIICMCWQNNIQHLSEKKQFLVICGSA